MRHIMTLAALACVPALLPAQAPDAAMPKVGDTAPDFTLAAGTIAGISAQPIRLSNLRGHTVVIAFYPRQRSSGCTIQMTHYRDAYDSIFGGGKDATLLAISMDSVKDIASWAQEAHFPFTMLSDINGVAGKEYATVYPNRHMERRILFVVGPDGKITHVMDPFNEVDPAAYQELTQAIHEANGKSTE